MHNSAVAGKVRVAMVTALLAATTACSSGSSSDGSTQKVPLPPAGTTTADLQATATAWAKAFLVGSVDDMKALEGPECASQDETTVAPRIVAAYLKGMRAGLRAHIGRDLDEIRIVRVETRNVTSTTGDALVIYDLPRDKVGNDNWVSYAVHGGRWKVADCHAPIAGSSSSSAG